jgi:hypothetical protein
LAIADYARDQDRRYFPGLAHGALPAASKQAQIADSSSSFGAPIIERLRHSRAIDGRYTFHSEWTFDKYPSGALSPREV